jgi:hypothetical protein
LKPLALLAVLSLAAAPLPVHAPAGVLHGRVSSVDGNVIRLADGLFAIDATKARILWNGNPATIAAVTKDSRIRAALEGDAFEPNAVLPAIRIDVTRPWDVELSGPVTAVDRAHGTFTILGIAVAADGETSFAPGVRLKPKEYLNVDAKRNGGRLVAVAVVEMSPKPDGTVDGVVSSIDGNTIRIADGLIAMSTAKAHDFKPGMRVLGTVAVNKPLVTSTIGPVTQSDVAMYGAVTAVDGARRKFTLLGQTVSIDAGTELDQYVELKPDALLAVFANRRGSELAASSVFVWHTELD